MAIEERVLLGEDGVVSLQAREGSDGPWRGLDPSILLEPVEGDI